MDPSSITQLIILIVLLILSGLFSSAETALTTVNRNKLRILCDEGSKRARLVFKMTEDPSKLLSSILIGNNVVNLSASALATTFCTKVFGSIYVGIATGILTFLVLIFGEITPKTLATLKSLQMSLFYAYPIYILTIVFTPIIWLLNCISGFIFKILRVDPNANPNQMTESELRTILDVSQEEGVIETEEQKMITNVVDFGDACSKDVMIPRADMVCVDIESSYEELLEVITEENYTRFPVYEESRDHVIGILNVKDLFIYKEKNGLDTFDLRNIMREPLYVYEYQKTAKIFADMKTSSDTVCIVLDEYGATVGLITMEDLVEEIVGEIRDEYDEDEADNIKKLGDDRYSVDAAIKLGDLNDAIGTELESEDYDSIGGYMIELLDRLPKLHDIANDGNVRLRVLEMEKNRVMRVEIKLLKKEEETAEIDKNATADV